MGGKANGAKPETPLALAKAKWTASGLTDAMASRLKYRAVSAAEAAKMAAVDPATQAGRAALVLPYFDFAGRQTRFFRLRYLGDPTGFAASLEKPVRYVQPPGTLNEVYMPPLRDWSKVRSDPETVLIVTEGELKAASACARGFACVGLGGVEMWRAGKRGIPLLPQLEEFEWDRREVFIVFDSDAQEKPDVMRAQLALARELTSRGAMPSVVTLPNLGDGKTGLDDFLVDKRGGADALKELVGQAMPFAQSVALHELNAEVLYVREPNAVAIRRGKQLLDVNGFVGLAFANRHHVEMDAEGKPKKRKTAQAWVEWPQRAEVEKVVYAPGQPEITEGSGWNVWPGWGCAPKRGDVGPWRKLLDYMFGAGTAERTWFERWCAAPLQQPGTKLYSAVAVWGVHQGTGKTIIGETLLRIYGQNGASIDSDHLHASFNSWAQHKQFVLGDEITGSDRRADNDRLKGMVTREKVRINVKYRPEYEVVDCVNYYFTSNHPDAFFLEDTDRRFFVYEAPPKPLPLDFYRSYRAWMRSPDGPAALFHHLLNLDMGDFDASGPAMETKAKLEMIRGTKSDAALWAMQLRDDPDAALLHLPETVRGSALFTCGELLTAYDPTRSGRVTANGLARELKRAGIRQINGGEPVRTLCGLQRLYAVRDPDKWVKAKVAACADQFAVHRTAKARKEKF